MKHTNSAISNGYCRGCRFYRGLHNTYLDRYGNETESYTHEYCTRKSSAEAKAHACFDGVKPYCFKS